MGKCGGAIYLSWVHCGGEDRTIGGDVDQVGGTKDYYHSRTIQMVTKTSSTGVKEKKSAPSISIISGGGGGKTASEKSSGTESKSVHGKRMVEYLACFHVHNC
jgi:hypothetical protein